MILVPRPQRVSNDHWKLKNRKRASIRTILILSSLIRNQINYQSKKNASIFSIISRLSIPPRESARRNDDVVASRSGHYYESGTVQIRPIVDIITDWPVKFMMSRLTRFDVRENDPSQLDLDLNLSLPPSLARIRTRLPRRKRRNSDSNLSAVQNL